MSERDKCDSRSREKRIHAAIVDWLQRFAHGQTVDVESFLACHGDLRPELEEMFDSFATTDHPADPAASDTLPVTSANVVAEGSVGDGRRYFGDYELLEEIARGGMGVVFKARQIKLNRIVALKMILSGALASEEEVHRFRMEAEAAANLDHVGIVTIYEVGENQGQHYFSMAFVEGTSLADRVKDGPLPPREAAEIVQKVADAVAYAHDKGVIHRDLKPANILQDSHGEPRVTDFGLAKQVESNIQLTRSGAVMGTPSYMPPEQASGKTNEIGPEADVYAVGAILYCLLTGRPPFHAASQWETLKLVLEAEPVPPRALNSTLPRDLETICLKCLQKNPESRYHSAAELFDDLGRFLNNEPIQARPVSRLMHGWKWCRRNPLTATLLTLVFTSIALMFFANTGWVVINAVAGIAREGYFRPKQEANNMRQLQAAIHAYHDTYPSASWNDHRQHGESTQTVPLSPGPQHRAIERLYLLTIQPGPTGVAEDAVLRRDLIAILQKYYEDIVRTEADVHRDEVNVAEAAGRLRLLERLIKP